MTGHYLAHRAESQASGVQREEMQRVLALVVALLAELQLGLQAFCSARRSTSSPGAAGRAPGDGERRGSVPGAAFEDRAQSWCAPLVRTIGPPTTGVGACRIAFIAFMASVAATASLTRGAARTGAAVAFIRRCSAHSGRSSHSPRCSAHGRSSHLHPRRSAHGRSNHLHSRNLHGLHHLVRRPSSTDSHRRLRR